MSVLTRSWLIILSALPLAACVAESGNGKVVSQQRTVSSFSKVEVANGIHATITQGDRSVAVVTDENLQAFIEATVRDDTLFLRVLPNFRLNPTGDLGAVVKNGVLEGLAASGGARVTADATPAATWPLAASGGSNIVLSQLNTPQLILSASGGSIVQAFGVATNITATGSGGSQVLTEGVEAENFTLEASGGSLFRVRATRSIQGNASGGSQVSVSGNPASRSITTSGASRVTWLNE